MIYVSCGRLASTNNLSTDLFMIVCSYLEATRTWLLIPCVFVLISCGSDDPFDVDVTPEPDRRQLPFAKAGLSHADHYNNLK
jgi:hypothetical protein